MRRATGGRRGGEIWFLILFCITLVYSRQNLSYVVLQRGGWGEGVGRAIFYAVFSSKRGVVCV